MLTCTTAMHALGREVCMESAWNVSAHDALVLAFSILCLHPFQTGSVETCHFDNKAIPLHIMTCLMAHKCIKSTN